MIVRLERGLQHIFGNIDADVRPRPRPEELQRLAATAAQFGHCSKITITDCIKRGSIEICQIFLRVRILKICNIGSNNLVVVAPLRFGIRRTDYLGAFRKGLEKAAACKPELVLVSAGFDAHADDPIGSLGLETEDFTTLSREVLDVARTHCKGRLVSCLEGGYNLEVLAEAVQAHLETLRRAG